MSEVRITTNLCDRMHPQVLVGLGRVLEHHRDVGQHHSCRQVAHQAEAMVQRVESETRQDVVPRHGRVPQHYQKHYPREEMRVVEDFVVGATDGVVGQHAEHEQHDEEGDCRHRDREVVTVELRTGHRKSHIH